MTKALLPESTKQPIAIGLLTLFIAIAMAVAFFVELSGYHLLTIDHQDHTYNTIVSRTISHDTPLSPFVMEYPVTNRLEIDELIRGYVANISNSYLHSRTAHTPKNEQLHISYEILFYDKRTLSVSFTQQKIQGQKSFDSHTEVLVFDLVLNKQLTPPDIIADPAALDDMLYDYQRTHNTVTPYSAAELVRLLDLTPADFTTIIPYGDKIIFSFSPHTSTGIAKPDTIAINKSLLGGIIRPAYQTNTVDHVQKEPSVAKTISEQPDHNEPIDPAGKKLALTFDDGPGADTPRLLDALKKYHAHATFFVIGNKVNSFAPTLRRTVAEGNEIGNHSWNHSDLTKLTPEQIDTQVINTQTAIRSATGGYTPRLIRPPYGALNATVSDHLHNLIPTLWNVDTRDWLDRNTDIIYTRIMNGAKQGNVILLHDIHPLSVDAAIRAIHDLRADGWQLVTVSQL